MNVPKPAENGPPQDFEFKEIERLLPGTFRDAIDDVVAGVLAKGIPRTGSSDTEQGE